MSKILKWGSLVVAVIIIGFIVLFNRLQYENSHYTPINYDDAYKEAQWQIKRACVSLKRDPCDYKLINTSTTKKHAASWTFDFESEYHSPVSILIYNDGDVDVLWN